MFYIIFIISFLFSEDFLKGHVFDSFNNPINNVNVEIPGEDLGTSTDVEGFFIINISGHETLKFSHIAFDYKVIHLSDFEEYNITVFLESKDIKLDRIVVTGTKSARHIKNTPILTHVITNSEINDASYSGVKDMLEIAMPNVQMVASNHGDDRVKVQGLDNKYLTFLVDGDRVIGEFAGNLDFSMLNLSNVDRIEVIEGAMSALYGSGSIGGVVNIITKKNTNPYWFNINFLNDNPLVQSISFSTGLNLKKIHYNLNYVEKKSDGYDLTPQSEYSKTLDESLDFTLQHKLNYDINQNNNIEFNFKDFSSNINKYTQIFDQATFSNVEIFDAPLNRYEDRIKKIKYNYKKSLIESIKITLFNEEYLKYYYYPYYNSINFIESGEQFIQGELDHTEFSFEYDYNNDKYKFLLGYEYVDQKYSAFNIYDISGDFLHESIFSGNNETKSNISSSLYFYNQWSLMNRNQLAIGLRMYDSNNKLLFDFLPSSKSKILSSISYLIRANSGYNYRLSFSSGYRNPSIKELYYEWTDHEPNVYGNPDLLSTRNNYFSISLDKRTFINDFSVDFYRNNITNMISTEYTDLGLEYKNYDDVNISGVNVHYYRKINKNTNLKFVYNLTYASSSSDEILEGISKHAFRLNLSQKLLDKLKMILNIKYLGEKNNFNQEQDWIGENSIKILEGYFLTDLYFIIPSKYIGVNFGVKNIFNYTDSSRLGDFSPDILSSYDPGRRYFMQLEINFNKK